MEDLLNFVDSSLVVFFLIQKIGRCLGAVSFKINHLRLTACE